MARQSHPFSSAAAAVVLLLPLAVVLAEGTAATFGLDFHHRFSDRVQAWAGPASWGAGGRPPERGTAEYFAALADHDRALLRGRGLAATSSQVPLTFADGNQTFSLANLAFLYYSFVSIGTPNVTFMVALDTGSDLFWVPCDCKQCASTLGSDFGFRKPRFFNTFSSNSSSTSKNVPCSSNYCDKSQCSASSATCPYKVKYLTENTTTSGYLLEDVLFLTSDETRGSTLQTRVTIGCGQVQTGAFLISGGFNGIIGLGLDKISIPSILADSGLTPNSFSMCFGRDDIVGRIVFGDKGGADQQTTPIMNTEQLLKSPLYVVSVMELRLNNNSLSTSFKAVFDTGTSFTVLTDPAYTAFSKAFDALVPYQRVRLPPQQQQQLFEYCYIVTSPNQTFLAPTINLIMNGGSTYPVLSPIVQLVASTTQGDIDLYCLGLLKDPQVNIIGQNFMSGLKVVFDREKHVLGWKEFNCYDKEKPLATQPHNTSSPTALAKEPTGSPTLVVHQTGSASGQPVNMHPFLSQIMVWGLVLGCLIQFSFPIF